MTDKYQFLNPTAGWVLNSNDFTYSYEPPTTTSFRSIPSTPQISYNESSRYQQQHNKIDPSFEMIPPYTGFMSTPEISYIHESPRYQEEQKRSHVGKHPIPTNFISTPYTPHMKPYQAIFSAPSNFKESSNKLIHFTKQELAMNNISSIQTDLVQQDKQEPRLFSNEETKFQGSTRNHINKSFNKQIPIFKNWIGTRNRDQIDCGVQTNDQNHYNNNNDQQFAEHLPIKTQTPKHTNHQQQSHILIQEQYQYPQSMSQSDIFQPQQPYIIIFPDSKKLLQPLANQIHPKLTKNRILSNVQISDQTPTRNETKHFKVDIHSKECVNQAQRQNQIKYKISDIEKLLYLFDQQLKLVKVTNYEELNYEVHCYKVRQICHLFIHANPIDKKILVGDLQEFSHSMNMVPFGFDNLLEVYQKLLVSIQMCV